jgi:hypothetical protein
MMMVLEIVAALVVIWRIWKKKFSRVEVVLLAVWLTHTIIELCMLRIESQKWQIVTDRYFIPADVILLGWISWVIVEFYRLKKWTILVLGVIIISMNGYSVAKVFKHLGNGGGARKNAIVVAAADIINKDWRGEDDKDTVFYLREYHRRARPVVFCQYRRLAWLVDGRYANMKYFGAVDYPDYWVVPVLNQPKIDGELLEIIEVGKGKKEQWGVYRRKDEKELK